MTNPIPQPHEDDVKLAENILKAFMEVPWRGMSKQQIIELVSKQVAIALNPLRTENEALRERVMTLEQEQAAITAGIQKENKLGTMSDDILDNFGAFVTHHDEVEAKLQAASEVIEKCERALERLVPPFFARGVKEAQILDEKEQALAAIKKWQKQ